MPTLLLAIVQASTVVVPAETQSNPISAELSAIRQRLSFRAACSTRAACVPTLPRRRSRVPMTSPENDQIVAPAEGVLSTCLAGLSRTALQPESNGWQSLLPPRSDTSSGPQSAP